MTGLWNNTALDQYVQRLQNLPSFDVLQVDPTGVVKPWYTVQGATIVQDLIIREADLALQVQTVAAQVGHWGRIVAVAKRVHAMREREYRVWKASCFLDAMTPPLKASVAKGEKLEWKKPTVAEMEAMYRTRPEYSTLNQEVERAEEAYNAASVVLDAFRVKRDALKIAVGRAMDQISVA